MQHAAHTQAPGWKAEMRETLRLAGPLALANLLQMLTYAIDVIFIARLGSQELAASALAVALFGLIVWSLQALTGAVAPIMAAEIGARGPALRPVRRAMRMALWLSLAVSVVGIALCLLIGPISRATGQDLAITAFATSYMWVLVWSLPLMVITGVQRSFVATLGRPIFATAITAVGILINAAANYAFIFGNWGAPALGLPGAAVATFSTSVAIVAMYALAIRLDPRLHRYRIMGFFWRPDWQRLAEIVRIGTPIAITVLAEAGVFGAAAFIMGRIGALELAAHTLAINLAAFAFQVPFGVGQAATIRVGYFYGARDAGGMGRAGWMGIAIGTGFMALSGLAMIVAPELLLSAYIDVSAPENAALVSTASALLLVAAAFALSDAVQSVAAGALRGLKDTRIPMWIAIFSYWVPGFGLAMWLGLATSLGASGVWIGLATGLTVAAALLLWRWKTRERLGLTQRSGER
ncbi:MATE family efflux transporter [Aurantiacibacter gangjinensis]|uniref:Multidrug-efflux transporter n=1 Tax=Aurantiacibacter gangjinensis TaxID=502682 RepID=A0A0G9MNE9_9SPHN|nr:MATE family efflux transporter [Aurantiacibacter gangjinensis]APE27748.1 putative multidrug resistance protein norM [Aurantiacibacter gangjinensis]KLE32242.1 multidrug transporter [Aurantiacibacter gangjinensis]